MEFISLLRKLSFFLVLAGMAGMAGCNISNTDTVITTPPEDQSTAVHPLNPASIIFFEDFEDPDYARNWPIFWDKAVGLDTVQQPAKYVFAGQRSAYLQMVKGEHRSRGHGEYVPAEAMNETVYIQTRVRLEDGFSLGTADGVKLFSVGGSNTIEASYGQSGVRPDGHNHFSAVISINNWNEPGIYFYHPDQSGGWGDHAYSSKWFNTPKIEPGRWYCLELMFKPNTIGVRDGEIRFWMDGELIVERTGMRFRDVEDVKIRRFAFTGYFGGGGMINTSPKNQRIYIDNYILSRERIGCNEGSLTTNPSQ